MRADYDALMQVRHVREQVIDLEQKTSDQGLKSQLHQLEQSVSALQGAGGGGRRGGGGKPSLSSLNGQLARVFEVIQGSDNAPTTQALAAVTRLQASVQQQLTAWKQVEKTDLAKLNENLRAAKLAEIEIDAR